MATNFAALYDACVLYPAPLRDLLLQLALTDLFQAKWTEQIHDEWIRGVLRTRPDLAEQLSRTRELMNLHVQDCLVQGYEWLIDGLANVLPDPNDRHVLAAAIHGQCAVIVTANLRDFPETALSAYGIVAQHPDDFIADLIELDSSAVARAIETCHLRLRNPPVSFEQYLKNLKNQGLHQTVKWLSL